MAYSGMPAHPNVPSSGAPDFRWWVPAAGISRQVIQSEIQRYLGVDALVRPGKGGNNQTTDGYYISAYRNLTSAMLEDLKKETLRVQKEKDAGSRYQDPPHHDPRHSGLGPTPPLAHTGSAYPPPGQVPTLYGGQESYPPPRSSGGLPGSGYPAAGYPSNVDPRDQYYQGQGQQPTYGGPGQPNVSPNSQHTWIWLSIAASLRISPACLSQ
ncbi:hypothetical protein BT63DRAFT_133340 [Microthyrium microscopicum]|uniref:Uncharacterized protein n=1 Tax=Microthyrium microscopicum TaxID=703497 RepID=A0A6A6UKD0_9PEZI|nr:hypothetical protein BT63DRAFT_133340 [Microthyrium microscopicum]